MAECSPSLVASEAALGTSGPATNVQDTDEEEHNIASLAVSGAISEAEAVCRIDEPTQCIIFSPPANGNT